MSNNLDLISAWPERQSIEPGLINVLKSGKSFKNCYFSFGGIWQVKLFLGREQRVLGHSRDKFRAVRFADMAIVYFIKYRQRRNRPLNDLDLNINIASANRDMAEIPQAREILETWEKALLSQKLITPTVQLFSEADDATQLRKNIALHWHQFGISIEAAATFLGDNPFAKAQLPMLREYQRHLNTCINSFDKIISETTPLV